jgi:hypothetical protein
MYTRHTHVYVYVYTRHTHEYPVWHDRTKKSYTQPLAVEAKMRSTDGVPLRSFTWSSPSHPAVMTEANIDSPLSAADIPSIKAAPCEATATHCDKESVAGEYYYSVNLVVKANKLTPGVTYTFACAVTDVNGRTSQSSAQVVINEAPSSGTVEAVLISAAPGSAMTSTYAPYFGMI